MKYAIISIIVMVLLQSCVEPTVEPVPKNNWKARSADMSDKIDLKKGSTYLSAYSGIYSLNESKSLPLTVTVSIRNPNTSDSIYISKADYYNTEGQLLKNYIDQPVYLSPMETVEIVISRLNYEGGSGANFIFDWQADSTINEPIFEAIMIHAYGGNYGLSFTTQGIPLKK